MSPDPKQDRSLAEDVAYWEDSLVSTLLDVEAEVPPKDIMQRVESSLFGSPEKQTNPFFGQRRGHADNGKAFPWKKFAVGVVVIKLTLVSAWYISQSARAASDARPAQTYQAPPTQ